LITHLRAQLELFPQGGRSAETGATLIPLPGSSHLFHHDDWMAVADAIPGFLCEPASTGRGAPNVGCTWLN
jgi:hypothetical protein